MPAPPVARRLPFSLPPDKVSTIPVSPRRSPHEHPRQSPGSPLGMSSTDKSPTEQVAEEWRRATGRAPPSRDGQMLHEGVTDEIGDVEESDDEVDSFQIPPVIIAGSPSPPPSPLEVGDVVDPPPPVVVVGSPSPPSSPSEVGPEPFHPGLLSRPLLPCTSFDEVHDQVHTLLDLVWVALPQAPNIYQAGQLEGTKGPTPREYNIPQPYQLKNIVYCVNMLAPIETDVAALLHAIPFDRTNQAHMWFATRVFPWFTSRNSPKRIYSEVDTEDWIRDTLIGPAHAVMHAVALGHIPDNADSPAYPFHSSAHCRSINRPDSITVLGGEHPNEVIPHIGEWKTPGVISIDENPLNIVQKAVKDVNRAGAAYKFNWPTPSATIAQRDKILCQLWTQFWEWDVCYGTLSSMELTSFYMRKRLRKNTLYISETYGTDEPTLFRMICWILLATGSNSLSLDVPRAYTRWWTPAMKNATNNGVVEA